MKLLWMQPQENTAEPYIVVYRCRFSLPEATTLSFRFSADERAQIFLDGRRIADGPERGVPERWYYQNGTVHAGCGAHVLTARVICFGKKLRAYAQMSIRHGFHIEDFSGHLRNWEYQIESGCHFEYPYPDWASFPRINLDLSYNRDILSGRGGIWRSVAYFEDERVLHAPDLPPMRYEEVTPDRQEGNLLFFRQYLCAWAHYRFTGHGRVKIRWAETPYLTEDFDPIQLKGKKGRRNGTHLVGNYDIFDVNGELTWHDYWWRAGHYVEIVTEGDVHYEAHFHRTGYPYPVYKGDSKLCRMAYETLQACSHETYMDCPYYEQLMYIGDSRLEALCTYEITDDHRLPAKALRLLSLSQLPDGALRSQYPSKSMQVIPSFMLVYLLMFHDYYRIHGRDELVEELLPRVGRLLDYLLAHRENGLLALPGWNFIDWCASWNQGTPPGGEPDSILNWLFALALQRLAEVNVRPGLQVCAQELKRIIHARYYNPEAGLYAIDLKKRHYSEHPQVLALLADPYAPVIPGLRKYELVQCSIYFSFYYLEACRLCGLDDLAEKRIGRWRALQEEGLTTFPEEFENPRSDCHAWSSHILYHLLRQEAAVGS